MLKERGFDVWNVHFGPAGIVIVLFVLLRVARVLLREIKQVGALSSSEWLAQKLLLLSWGCWFVMIFH
jgi:hypothetical protein